MGGSASRVGFRADGVKSYRVDRCAAAPPRTVADRTRTQRPSVIDLSAGLAAGFITTRIRRCALVVGLVAWSVIARDAMAQGAEPASTSGAAQSSWDLPSASDSASDSASSSDSWEVVPTVVPQEASSWDVPPSEASEASSGWDDVSQPAYLPESAWDAEGASVSTPLPPTAFEVESTSEVPQPASTDDSRALDASTWQVVPQTEASLQAAQRDSTAVVRDAGAFAHLAVRLTVAGYRESLGLSLAWTKPTYGELELGAFVDLWARQRLVTPPENEGDEPQVQTRLTRGAGAYFRASLAYPVLDKRGLADRAWVVRALAGLEARVVVVERETAILAVLATGVDASFWRGPRWGVVMGTSLGLPMWELRTRTALSLRPVLRIYLGVAF